MFLNFKVWYVIRKRLIFLNVCEKNSVIFLKATLFTQWTNSFESKISVSSMFLFLPKTFFVMFLNPIFFFTLRNVMISKKPLTKAGVTTWQQKLLNKVVIHGAQVFHAKITVYTWTCYPFVNTLYCEKNVSK